MSDAVVTLLILAVAVAVFVWNRVPIGVVALGVALALWATGIVTLEQALAGFGSPTVVLIAALFVVAEALDAAGITTWAGQWLVGHAGTDPTRLLVLTMVLCAALSALITPNGAVAALFPMVVVLAVRLGQLPGRLLMPLAFAAHAGSLLVLTGSPVNILAAEAATEAGGRGFAFFEYALVGVPALAGTVLVAALFGPRLLPERAARTLPRDLSALPGVLRRQYVAAEELARLSVASGSPLIGAAADAIAGAPEPAVRVIGALNGRGSPIGSGELRVGDTLIVRGPAEDIDRFATASGLARETGGAGAPESAALIGRDVGVAEVIVAPRSNLIGERVFPGMVTESGALVVLAVQRHGEDLGVAEVALKPGDALLLQGPWAALDEHTADPNVVLVDSPDAIRRQAAPLGPRAVPALAVLAGMVALLTAGVVPAAVACLMAAMAMVLLGVVSVEHAHRAISWTTLILVAGMIPLSTAIADTGVAEMAAKAIVGVVGGAPYLLLVGLFLITAVFGQLISNTATALIVFPIAVSAARETGLSPLPLLMCVNVAAAAALLTPVATPANMMVMGPAGYRFGDYWKLGLAVMAVYFLVAVVLVPVVWPL